MALNDIKKQIDKDFELKIREIEKSTKQEKQEIIKKAQDQSKLILEKANDDLNQDLKQLELEVNSQIEFEKNKNIILEKEAILNKELLKLKQIFIKQIQKESNKLIDLALKQITQTLNNENIFIDINKKFKINEDKLKKYNLKYTNQDNIIIHDENYNIKITISPDKLFEDNIELIKHDLSKQLFKNL
ncbi:MAG: hypothetical protein M1168_02810 [Candidatus Marsarchaeota archaeon]|nr:hypothetical protein [Candidatus Marsarchaeota archaeon]MCL5094887.1 hypothetical protein [Candidatus Marsarchaeota archaeon]